jgi:large subunit ribosomal protein L18
MNYVQRQSLRIRQRTKRVRAKIFGTADRPRITVDRSNKHIALQVINDDLGVTLVASTDRGLAQAGTKTEKAINVAKQLAQAMKKAKLTKAAFDRGPYKYHGRVKAVAETLRAEGIEV